MGIDELSGLPNRLDHLTWAEVDAHIEAGGAVILPAGSTEQHGPMGLIGTDALCAQTIAEAAAALCDAIVTPALAYTPAPFNTAFPGTLSIPTDLFEALAGAVLAGLQAQGFRRIFVLNGHGANLEPLGEAIAGLRHPVNLYSWWDFDEVNALRRDWYGCWEGMHATPSEISITQAAHRTVPVPTEAQVPPEQLSAAYLATHAGDRHGPPNAHRARFPDGRVGSHSALARPEHGRKLIDAAARALAAHISATEG